MYIVNGVNFAKLHKDIDKHQIVNFHPIWNKL